MNPSGSQTIEVAGRQRAIQARCFHPSGEFVQFERGEIEQSIPERFEQQVRKHPDRLAVKTQTGELTYDVLNENVNRVANAILERCGEGSEPIALLFEHGAPVITAILGVLKAGKFYVPLDPSYPRARSTQILEDSQARLVLTNNRNRWAARDLAKDAVQLINIDELPASLSAGDPGISIRPDAFAYIVYTSGSTGQPKGVIVDHRDVLHFTMIFTNKLHICSEDRLSLIGHCSFSGSAVDIFSALLNGAALFPFDVKVEGVANMAAWLIDEEITGYGSVPGIFRNFAGTLTQAENFPNLRIIRLGGERMYRSDVELYMKHFASDCIMRHGLGSSEVKIYRWYLIDMETEIADNIVPVGYAVDDTEVLLLDDDDNDVGFNQVGEIVVRSRYMSPGYWRSPEATSEKFLADPNGGGERIYHTGDLGLLLPDGCLMHKGRKDLQVKIRGYRVEVAEIEEVLAGHIQIKEAVVVARADRGAGERLVAYLVPTGDTAPKVAALRRLLAEKLPEYMIPSAFVTLESLPLTPSGKVDRRGLPQPSNDRPDLDNPFVAPRTPIEEELTQIWSQLLGLGQLGVYDNFLELGGHSLLATQAISRVIDAFRVDLPLGALFDSPTVADMAVVITQRQAQKAGRKEMARMFAELDALSDDPEAV